MLGIQIDQRKILLQGFLRMNIKELKRMWQFLIELYDRLPDRIHIVAEPSIKILKILLLFVSELRVRTFLVRFEFPGEEQPLTVLFVGKEKQLEFLKRFAGSSTCTIARDASLLFWKIKSYLKKTDKKSYMAVIYLNKILYSLIRPEGYLRMPDAVKSQLLLNGTFGEIIKKFREGAARKCGNVSRAGCTCEISRDMRALEHFYYEMYIPYMKNRFKELAVIDSYYKMRRLFRTGFLLIVRKEGQYLSGVVCRIKQDTFVFELVGIEQGNVQLLNEGALDALYYFSIREALNNRCRMIDFGNSNPFLNDGLVLYKRKWGTVLMPNPKQVREAGVKIHGIRNGGDRFILDHYPIFFQKRGMAGLVVKDSAEPMNLKEMRQIENTYFTPGLNNLVVVSSGGFEQNSERNVVQDFSDRIKLIKLSQSKMDTKTILSELGI
jgi:hypothetical protein